MGSHAEAEACPGLLIPPSETRAHSCCLPLQGSTTVPARPGMNILGPETEDAPSMDGIESKIL